MIATDPWPPMTGGWPSWRYPGRACCRGQERSARPGARRNLRPGSRMTQAASWTTSPQCGYSPVSDLREVGRCHDVMFHCFYPPSEEYIETSLLDPYPALNTKLSPININTWKVFLIANLSSDRPVSFSGTLSCVPVGLSRTRLQSLPDPRGSCA